VLWFILNRDAEDDEDDGGVERSVKAFARKVSYISFAWRVSNHNNRIPCLYFVFFHLDFSGTRSLERLLRLYYDCESQKH